MSTTHDSATQVGVADYYAILGVGDTLVWKHEQKQHETQTQQPPPASGETSPTHSNDDDPLTDEWERWGREIVAISIVERHCTVTAPAADTAASTEGRTQGATWSSAPLPSGDDSSVGTTTTATTPSSAVRLTLPLESTSATVTELGGDGTSWNVVRTTLPCAALESLPASRTTHRPWSLAGTTTWDANLDWEAGLRSRLLAVRHNATADRTTPAPTLTQPSPTPFPRMLRHSVEANWKRLQPLKGNSETHTPNDMNAVAVTNQSQSHFYVSYQRRRQRDEGPVQPAIADVQLWYAHVPRILLVSPEMSPNDHFGKLVLLQDYLTLPLSYDEWSIPESYQWIRDPAMTGRVARLSLHHLEPHATGEIETIADTVPSMADHGTLPNSLMPRLVSLSGKGATSDEFCMVPVLMIRRQRCGEEERFHEDPAVTDVTVSFVDENDTNAAPVTEEDDLDDMGTFRLLGQTPWTASTLLTPGTGSRPTCTPFSRTTAMPVLLVRKNVPSGFADAAFATRVWGRFPLKNYKGLPLPEEELPMFCYPTGCRLVRSAFSDAPLPQYYGFVVKNERGDSVYVSCVSFMEPLTATKVQQLAKLSEQRQRTSLPHSQFCNRRSRSDSTPTSSGARGKAILRSGSDTSTEAGSNVVLTAFNEMTTFENKTICLVSRYPFWTAFRKFLSHLHILSGSVLDLPLERYISHLLLSVPLPRPGGPSVLVPLPALNEPMILTMPPVRDLPLLNLPYQRLFACLDIKTIVTIVLGVLVLERKIIVLSTRPALVLDVCELLRSLLFPFELCAPYVPRLTEPFKSSLDFPGAIFVGIHDDGDPNGLAAMVKASFPEESIIVDLDTGDMDCDGDRYDILTGTWNIIPKNPRSLLISELQALCKDASIIDGQEPLDSLLDSAFYVDLADAVDGYDVSAESSEDLDDRAVRDAFLRFFCSVLGGYERFLVVPDADFLVSGNEWFDTQGFLASVPTSNAAYMTSLVSTQLFQSFIQRRTEASDVHCMLFDECVVEFHSSSVPYGRLGGDVETIHQEGSSPPHVVFSLLVDQSAATAAVQDQATIAPNRSMDTSDADSSFSLNLSRVSVSVCDSAPKYCESFVNSDGDLVTSPSHQDLSPGEKFVYCLDGSPCFPHALNADLFLPLEPTSWAISMAKVPEPLLARSDRELEEANRRRRMATSSRGSNQRRCLWQLPKLMGSHFFGSWLLCVPAMVSQLHLSNDQQSRYLLRALGALRLLRSKQRIVPDEAAYRALMVACGRTRSDRRVELVKLFGLLRSDGIFPSAVTLGQYTKSLAEGYSKRPSDNMQDEGFGMEVTESGSRLGRYNVTAVQQRCLDLESSLYNLDTSLKVLETQGKKWRHGQGDERGLSTDNGDEPTTEVKNRRFNNAKSWLPVLYSSSFSSNTHEAASERSGDVSLTAIWSRTRGCTGCSYIPLEEEIQAGWDVVGENEIPGAIRCPRCDSLIVPMLGFKEMRSGSACLAPNSEPPSSDDDFDLLPPQIRPTIDVDTFDDSVGYVAYVNPSTLRVSLEQLVEKYGEDVLERDQLKQLDPEVFYNFWWYCARFSLPLPLPVSQPGTHGCAFVSWDRSAAERGCTSAAKILNPLLRLADNAGEPRKDDPLQNDMFDETPLLSRYNLQGFYSSVWEHSDLQQLLVTLVEACDKDNFRLVVESAIRINQQRKSTFEASADDSGDCLTQQRVQLDVYRTILYLAKYQCTSVFHAFFPATLKPCKGYHFWCAIGTPLPIFDRLLRDAMRRVSSNREAVPMHHVSDVAVAFRCVFGHLI